MIPKSKFKTILWELASYNPFFVNYCKTSYNNFSSIGLLFFIQILIAFFSGYVSMSLFFDNIFISLLVGICYSTLFYFYIKKTTFFISVNTEKIRIQIVFLLSILVSAVFTLPFLIKLFIIQIEYSFLIKNGLLNLTIYNKIWKLPYGLFQAWLNKDNGSLIVIISISFYFFMLFILQYPFTLIFKNFNSIYYKLSNLYEEEFSK